MTVTHEWAKRQKGEARVHAKKEAAKHRTKVQGSDPLPDGLEGVPLELGTEVNPHTHSRQFVVSTPPLRDEEVEKILHSATEQHLDVTVDNKNGAPTVSIHGGDAKRLLRAGAKVHIEDTPASGRAEPTPQRSR